MGSDDQLHARAKNDTTSTVKTVEISVVGSSSYSTNRTWLVQHSIGMMMFSSGGSQVLELFELSVDLSSVS